MKIIFFLLILITFSFTLKVPKWVVNAESEAKAELFAAKHGLEYLEQVGKYHLLQGKLSLKKLLSLQKLRKDGIIFKQVPKKQVLKKLNSNFFQSFEKKIFK